VRNGGRVFSAERFTMKNLRFSLFQSLTELCCFQDCWTMEVEATDQTTSQKSKRLASVSHVLSNWMSVENTAN